MKDTGGPVFPLAIATTDGNGRPLSVGEVEAQGFMTLRDHFAAQAAGALAVNAIENFSAAPEDVIRHAAMVAYALADAMLEERK